MTQSIDDATSTQTQSLSLAARLAWVVLIIASLYLCYFQNLGAIGLVGPDEPRYAWIARDMAESGDWITPRLYGKPWFEKPPLYYWSAAVSFKLFGISETTARLPSAIYALLATLAMAWLALRIYGAETARWLLLLLPTSVAMIAFSHAAATDMPFAATLHIAMVFATQLLGLESSGGHDFSRAEKPLNKGALAPEVSSHHPNLVSAIFFGFFLGLAVLAKGPAAIIFSGGTVFFWAVFTKRWRDAFRCLHPLAIATFCATALPWYILCARRNPDFFRVFIIEHNFKRFLTPEFQHIQPFWYYAGILLLAFLPWTLLLLYTTIRGALNLWRTRAISHPALFLLCWSLFVVIFFSISKSKLPGYILPAIPAIGLLVVRGYLRAKYRNEMALRWLLVATGMIGLLVFVLAFTVPLREDARVFQIGAWVLLGLTLPQPLLGLWEGLGRRVFNVSPLSVVPILVLLYFYPFLQSAFLSHRDISGKTLAAELTASHISPDNVYVDHMQRGRQYSLSFYLHREVKNWDAEPKEGYLLLASRNCKAIVSEPWTCSTEPISLERSGYFLYRVSTLPNTR